MAKKKILVIGQTPPPYGGQAMMVERTLKGDYGADIELFHIRMKFSKEMSNVGKFELGKVFHLFQILILAYYYRFFLKNTVLYYFPAGPRTIPIIRDIFILGFIRPFFSKVIFHFRAAGISEYITKQNKFYKALLKVIYSNPDVGIRLSEYTPEDDKYLGAKKRFIVYNGIEDFLTNNNPKPVHSDKIKLVYLGVINRSKGIFDLIHSFNYLKSENTELNLIGQIESDEINKELSKLINENNLYNKVKFLGVLTGSDKFNVLFNSDIFVFPSYFESEGLPGAILEAMCFSKPIVATNWRGIPSMVIDNENGFLVPIKSPEKLAEKIDFLISNESLRRKFGEKSRELFLEKFTIDKYYKNMKKVFETV